MKTFTYTIKEKLGIHARPAGSLVKKAKEFQSVITIEKDEKKVNLTKLFSLMGLGVKCGDNVIINIDGVDEDAAFKNIKDFFENNL